MRRTVAAFLHVPKTGGTSVMALWGDMLMNVKHQNYRDCRKQFALRDATPGAWNSLFKFSFVRNPWARHLAFFFHSHRTVSSSDDDCITRFEKHIELCYRPVIRTRNPDQMYGGAPPLDFVGQFEMFEDGLSSIARVLQIDASKLEHINRRPERQRVSDWRPLYTERTHDAVAEFGEWEITRFGYAFDDCREEAA